MSSYWPSTPLKFLEVTILYQNNQILNISASFSRKLITKISTFIFNARRQEKNQKMQKNILDFLTRPVFLKVSVKISKNFQRYQKMTHRTAVAYFSVESIQTCFSRIEGKFNKQQQKRVLRTIWINVWRESLKSNVHCVRRRKVPKPSFSMFFGAIFSA